jgi:hypothetical protein
LRVQYFLSAVLSKVIDSHHWLSAFSHGQSSAGGTGEEVGVLGRRLGTQFVEIVGPPLHHAAARLEVRRAVVGPS